MHQQILAPAPTSGMISPLFESPVRRFPMTNQAAEVAKRRTFAIISHPDLTL